MARICFVVSESCVTKQIGFHQMLAVEPLARLLVKNRYEVTILFVKPGRETVDLSHEKDVFAGIGVRFVVCPEPAVPMWDGALRVSTNVAYYTFEWLKNQATQFDIVASGDSRAPMYFCQQAKILGMYFLHTRFVVFLNRPMVWNMQAEHSPILRVPELFQIHKERLTVEWADHVICLSAYLFDWVVSHGYRIEKLNCSTIPLLGDIQLKGNRIVTSPSRIHEFKEIIFFGAFRQRDGLHYFLNAMLRLENDPEWSWDFVKISFIGRFQGDFNAKEEFAALRSKVKAVISIQSCITFEQALNYLEECDSPLVVLPFIATASPNCIGDLISRNIPFVVSNDSGCSELIKSECHDEVIFDSHPYSLYKKIKDTWSTGISSPTLTIDRVELKKQWLDVFDNQIEINSTTPTHKHVLEEPLISICIAHFNRPDMLVDALNSALDIDYVNKEIIIIDDGSTDRKAIDRLTEIENKQFSCDVRVYTQPNLYLGASRNHAARKANGEYILFMDDDNLAKREELTVMVRAALYSGADILTCFSDTFYGDNEPDSDSARRITFFGADISSGLIHNPFGDSNSLIKRSTFNELGGFTEHYKVGRDDQEFFARASILGKQLYAIPEALYWYRINTTRMRQTQFSQYAGLQRVLEPYLKDLPVEIANIIRYAQGLAAIRTGVVSSDLVVDKSPIRSRVGNRYTEKLSVAIRRFPRIHRFAKRIVHKFPFIHPSS